MKTYYKETLAWIALVSAIVLFSFTISFAQMGTEGKVHIHIEKEVNGNAEIFDTTFTSTSDNSPDGAIIPPKFNMPVPPNPYPRPDPVKPVPHVDTINIKVYDNWASAVIEDDQNNIKKQMELGDEKMKIPDGGKYSLIIKEGDEDAPPIEKKTENDGQETYMYKHFILIEKNEEVPPGGKNGIENILQLNDLKVFPNPSDGQVRISFHLNTRGNLNIRLTDIAGKELYFQQSQDFTGNYNNLIDLSDKGKGIYILSIEQNNKMLTKKIVIN